MKAVFKSNEVDYHPEFRPITQIRQLVQEPQRYPACDACNDYEAEVKFNGMHLCSGCCQEEGIEVL